MGLFVAGWGCLQRIPIPILGFQIGEWEVLEVTTSRDLPLYSIMMPGDAPLEANDGASPKGG